MTNPNFDDRIAEAEDRYQAARAARQKHDDIIKRAVSFRDACQADLDAIDKQIDDAVYESIKASEEIDVQSLVVRRLELAAIADVMPRVLKRLHDEMGPLDRAGESAAHHLSDLKAAKRLHELTQQVKALRAAGDNDRTIREKLNLSPRELDRILGRRT
jgi:hypothetical protein